MSSVRLPARSTERCALADGVEGLWPGVAWLPASRALVVADAHLAYEDVIGGALPLWSTGETVAMLTVLRRRTDAREIVFLGDVVHGARMSEGAARGVRAALDALRAEAEVTLVAGNHEGRSRAFAVLGATVERLERDGWLLVHGDGAPQFTRRTIVGHLHPSLDLGGGATAPAFVASESLVIVPALTPYSPGLDCCSDDVRAVLGAWNVRPEEAHVAAVGGEFIHPFGALSQLRALLRGARRVSTPGRMRRRKRLGPDY
jgi:metallophosphoesterase superfamily enzyme